MKTLPTLAAVAIAMALVLSPMVVNAAGSITFTSPASGASYSNAQTYTISGTISPAPTQADQVGITVKNPSGQTVDIASATVTSGSFSYTTAVGGTASWTTGTYTITALDSYGATGTTSFTYTSPTSSGVSDVTLDQWILGNQSLILTNQQTIMSDLSAITGTLSTLSTTVGNIQSAVTSLTSTVGTIGTNVQTLSNQLPSAGTISSTQTYVLVVAVLAAITLVLELAILVRKIS